MNNIHRTDDSENDRQLGEMSPMDTDPAVLLPRDALEELPFDHQPASDWDTDPERNGPVRFLRTVFDQTHAVRTEDGEVSMGTSEDYGNRLYRDERDRFLEKLEEVQRHAEENNYTDPRTGEMVTDVPDLHADPEAGRAGQYIIAWRGAVESILSEFQLVEENLSLPHLLESRSDLEASRELVRSFHYRPALQQLRNVLEHHVWLVYYALIDPDTVDIYENWLNNPEGHKVDVTGDESILAVLSPEDEIIDKSLRTRAEEQYDKLTAAVNNAHRFFVHRIREESGEPGPRVFYTEDFHRWCDWTAETLDVCLHLLHTALDGMESTNHGGTDHE